jgi:hypothetical protein
MIFWNRKLKAAGDRYTPDFMLTRLAEAGNVKVQAAVGGNRNVQRHMIEKLSKSESMEVRKAVASNPSKMTGQIWDALRVDPDSSVVKELLAHHPVKPGKHDRRS